MKCFANGSFQYVRKKQRYKNNGTETFEKNQFALEGYRFIGWKVQIKIDTRWFWYMEDGTLGTSRDYGEIFEASKRLFQDEAEIPYIPVNRIRAMIAKATWEEESDAK